MSYTDEYIEHWAAVYEHYGLSRRALSFEQFLTNPWGYIVELAGGLDMLPRQAAVARQVDAQDLSVVSEQSNQHTPASPSFLSDFFDLTAS